MPHPGEIVHARDTFEEPGGRRRGGGGAAAQARRRGHALHRVRRRRDRAPLRSASCEELGRRACEARFRPEPQRRAFVHLDRRASAPSPCSAPRLGPRGADRSALGASSTTPTPSTSPRRRRAPCARRAGRGTLVATPRGLETLAEARRGARRARGERPRSRRALQRRRPRPGAAGRWCAPRGPRAASGRPPRRARQLGRRRRCRARSATPTAAGDSFAAGLTYGLGAGWELQRGARARPPAAAPPASPAAARTRASSTGSSQATWPSAGSIGRPSSTHAIRPPSRLWASKPAAREGLGGQRRAAARAAVEDDRPLAVDATPASAVSRSSSMWRVVRDAARVALVRARARRRAWTRRRAAARPRARGRGPPVASAMARRGY